MLNKSCSTCKETKRVDDFRRDKRTKDGRQCRCKLCVIIATKKAYQNKYKYKTRLRNKGKRDEFRKNMDNFLKDVQCSRCGEDHPATLDFHHIDRTTKEYEVSQMRTFAWERVLNEIQKCIILCANCHRKHHWKMLAGNNTYVE